MDRTEVSYGQYQQCVDAGVCNETPPPMWFKPIPITPDHPAMTVFDDNMNIYCSWVGGRLPTEAEWEYAARGPDNNLFPWGNTFDPDRLNYCDMQCDAAFPDEDPQHPESWADMSFDDGYTYPAPVGSFPEGASWCGALDMAGNMAELVSDWRGVYTSDAKVNPTGPSGEGEFKIIRGGAWNSQPYFTRSTYRTAIRGGGSADIGFRCVVPIND
jgi:formylglycine-generating enzyme required for sulfatase activity